MEHPPIEQIFEQQCNQLLEEIGIETEELNQPTAATPKQNELKYEYRKVSDEFSLLCKLKSRVGINNFQQKRIKYLRNRKEQLRKNVRKIRKNQKCQQKLRQKKKSQIESIMNENPEIAEKLRSCNKEKQG
ncbi:unnamed protein product, partial [Allacma fusca]